MKNHMHPTSEEAEILGDFDRGELVNIEGFEEERHASNPWLASTLERTSAHPSVLLAVSRPRASNDGSYARIAVNNPSTSLSSRGRCAIACCNEP